MHDKILLDRKETETGLNSKRFKFWLENIPADLRRIEYDLWERYRILHHAKFYQFKNKRQAGRFSTVPGYPLELQEKDWQEFAESFLTGEERKNRFQDVVVTTQKNLDKIIGLAGLSKDGTLLIALTGSTVYGPRQSGEKFSDIDIGILLKHRPGGKKLNILPEQSQDDTDQPFHISVCGDTDESRTTGSDIHWLLYPFYSIESSISPDELQKTIDQLVAQTLGRLPALEKKVALLDKELEETRKGGALD